MPIDSAELTARLERADRARLALGISDVRGIGGVLLEWGGVSGAAFNPGTGVLAIPNGVHTPVSLPAAGAPFSLTVNLRGSGRLALLPSAEAFTARMASPWAHPSFDGAYLPDGRRVAFDSTGVDQVEFLISANPGEPLKPMARVASGGETARLMLQRCVMERVRQIQSSLMVVWDLISQAKPCLRGALLALPAVAGEAE